MFLLKIFSRKWLLTTLLVVIAAAVMVRLGFWQLDRLAQRRAFNARVLGQINQPLLILQGDALQADLANMEYRKVTVRGKYDFSQEVALRNQAMNGQWGVDLLTPLEIEGTHQAVLVDRGWIPGDDYSSGQWSKYSEPGTVEVSGVIRDSQSRPDFGRKKDQVPAPGEPRLLTWNFVNVTGIGQQIAYTTAGYTLLPMYIQEAPEPAWTGMPIRTQPQVEITEGPHMGYAIQWFAFAAILVGGYPFFIRKQENTPREPAGAKIPPSKTPSPHEIHKDAVR